MEKQNVVASIVKVVLIVIMLTAVLLGINGCTKSSRVNFNIKQDADNFKIHRRVIALNTRTGEALFQVEGLISIGSDDDGDLNVTIKTGNDDYKLFYAHLSTDVTYTCVQLESAKENPYAYKITFFPVKEQIENGLIDLKSTKE